MNLICRGQNNNKTSKAHTLEWNICSELLHLRTYCGVNYLNMEQARSVSERTFSCHGCGGGEGISVKIFPFGQYVTLAVGLFDHGQVNAILAIICWSETRTWVASYLFHSLACRIWFVWLAQNIARTKSPGPRNRLLRLPWLGDQRAVGLKKV